jgi:PKD repeat protein
VLWPTFYGPDPYRQTEWHNGIRFLHEPVSVSGIESDVFRPCAAGNCPDLPDGLETFEPPYSVVIAMHGALSDKDHLWRAAQPLAERSYFVVAAQSNGSSIPGAVLDWLDGEAQTQYPGQLDLSRVGTMGHSLGAENSTRVQGDDRVSAIIAWNPCSGSLCANSRGSRLHDKGEEAQTPTLFITADYTGFPGYPQPRFSVPGELRAAGFSTLRDNGMDSMLITPRATTHLDWAGNFTMGTRYGETTSNQYNLAWFDRYLRGKLVHDDDGKVVTTGGRNQTQERAYRQAIAQQGFNRLVTTEIDGTLDRHNISQGFFDPAQLATSLDPEYGGNVPYATEGLPTANLLSFYYRSVCFVSVPNYNTASGGIVARGDSTNEGDMRKAGCPVNLTAIDSDGDGVDDAVDQCPGTAQNTTVDANGCELPTEPLTVSLSADPTSGDVSNGPLTVNFSADAVDLDPAAGDISYVFYYGDGSNSGTTSANTAVKKYDKAGTYSASVVVVDENNNSAQETLTITTTSTVTVEPGPIVVDAKLNVRLSKSSAPVTATFDASGSTAPEDSIYAFNFGDGDSQQGTESQATHTYGLAGTYTVTLTVTDSADANNKDTVTAEIKVGSGQQTTVQLVVTPTTVGIGEDVSFDARSSIPEEGAEIVRFTFDFGDNTSISRTVEEFGADAGIAVHAYQASGNFSPVVTVVDSFNTSKRARVAVRVEEPATAPPVAPAAAGSSGGGGVGLLFMLIPLLGAGLRRRRSR